MKSRRLSLTQSVFFTAVAVLALAHSALADGEPGGNVARFLADANVDHQLPHPAGLNEWKDAAEELDLREAPMISLSQFPQGRLAQKDPFIDFSKWELGAFVGAAVYSSDFDADPDWVLGITTRVPVPGIPLGEWGLWGQVMLGHIARDIPFYYPHSKGEWYGVAVGGDYTLLTTEILFLRAQGGLMYAHWNGIQALDNGTGVLVGAEFGFFWIKHNSKASLTFNPQLNFDGDNWIGLINFGFSYDF
jgi:hypothetical protein